MCGLDPAFLLQLWDRLIDQTNLTLNLLRASRINPKMAAENMLNGPYDFNRTPLAPLGAKFLVHEKPAVRGTWAPHALDGWHIGPSTDQYRCYKCIPVKTNRVRISDTVNFFPSKCDMPFSSSVDNATQVIQKLAHAIKNPALASPFQLSEEQFNAI